MTEEAPATGPTGEILVYEVQDSELRVEVRLEGDNVWLTQRQMANVFDTTSENVLMHLRNVFSSGELEATTTARIFPVIQAEGRRRVRRNIRHYNLDAIIAVGYRVNSRQGVRFRQWASRVIREHLVHGFTFNRNRLAECGVSEARGTLDRLASSLRNQAVVGETDEAILRLIMEYADTWRTLFEYDEDRLERPSGTVLSQRALDADRTVHVIETLKRELMARGEATSLFGNRRDDALEAILGNIEQTMFDEPLYRSREERAAHLLYFVVKDHPFTDGNKRLGAFLFLLYLARENITHQLDPRALTALTLLIAESTSDNKDLMVRLTMHLLQIVPDD